MLVGIAYYKGEYRFVVKHINRYMTHKGDLHVAAFVRESG